MPTPENEPSKRVGYGGGAENTEASEARGFRLPLKLDKFSESKSHLFHLHAGGRESKIYSVCPLSVIDDREYAETHVSLLH